MRAVLSSGPMHSWGSSFEVRAKAHPETIEPRAMALEKRGQHQETDAERCGKKPDVVRRQANQGDEVSQKSYQRGDCAGEEEPERASLVSRDHVQRPDRHHE